MMLRLKTGFTIFAVYEIAAIILLHCTRTCDAMFGTMFCNDHAYKYFIWCVAIPLIVFLITMWIRTIFMGGRRRRFMHRAGRAMHDVFDDVRERVSEKVSPQEIEGIITAAVMMGIKKLSEKFPNAGGAMRRAMRDNGRSVYSDDDDTDDDMPMTRSKSRTTSRRTVPTNVRRKK